MGIDGRPLFIFGEPAREKLHKDEEQEHAENNGDKVFQLPRSASCHSLLKK